MTLSPRLNVAVAALAAVGFLTNLLHAEVRDPKQSLQVLKDRESAVRAVVQKVMPAVVCLSVQDGAGTGSGVIINKEGLILTAGHVTQALGANLEIIFPDGRRVKGKSLGANMNMDSGLAKIEEPGDYPFVELGNSNQIHLGDWVVAMGHPGGFNIDRKPPIRIGRVWDRDRVGAIFSDCTLIGGDSGGPLFDLQGRLIGIHSSINRAAEHNRHIALDTFRGDWDDLMAGKSWGQLRMSADDPSRPMPRLGISLDRAAAEDGALVTDVPESSPAAKTGVKVGDRIVKVDGAGVTNYWALMRELSDHKAGDSVKLTVKRGAEEVQVEIRTFSNKPAVKDKPREKKKNQPKEAPPEEEEEDTPPEKEKSEKPAEPKIESPGQPRPYFGAQIGDDSVAKGAKVLEAPSASPAGKGGLKPGDTVIGVDGREIKDAVGLAEVISGHKPGDKLKVTAKRDGQNVDIEITLEKK